jgi:hypothetical protein
MANGPFQILIENWKLKNFQVWKFRLWNVSKIVRDLKTQRFVEINDDIVQIVTQVAKVPLSM